MQSAPAGFAAALEARQSPTVTAAVADPSVDLASSSGWADTITVTRELSGELPDAASTVVGGVSGMLEVSGDAFADGAPSPMRPADARTWLRSMVDVWAGYDGLTVPAFSGRLADLNASESSGVLTLSARDAADRLTEPVRIRPYGSWARAEKPGDVQRSPVNTEGVVAAILHSNGIRVTPAPRAGCDLSVPGVGGWIADTGWTVPGAGGSAPAVWLTAGRFGSMPNVPAQTVRAFSETQRTYGAGYFMLEAFVNVAGSRTLFGFSLAAGGRMFAQIASGQLQIVVRPSVAETVIASTAIDTGWRHVCVEIRADNVARIWVDGVQRVAQTGQWSASIGIGTVDMFQWDAHGIQALAAYYSGSGNVAPSPSIMSFTPEADVSRGALDLMFVPDVDGRVSWDVLKEVAEAELGMVGFSEAGRFFFRNRAELAANVSPVATWDVDLVDDLKASASVDSILTRATARVKRSPGVWSGRGAGRVLPVPALVADNVIAVPPGTSSVVLSASSPFIPEQQILRPITEPGAAWESAAGMALCLDADGNNRYMGTDVRAWIVPLSPTSVRVNLFNAVGSTFYAVWPRDAAWNADAPYGFTAGGPSLWLLGYRLAEQTEQMIDRSNSAGVAAWGTQLHAFGDSPWWQDAATVDDFLAAFLTDTSVPRATIADVTVPADPRLQLGDPVRLEDFRGRVPGVVARITSIKLTLTRDVENRMIGTYGLRQIVGSIPEITLHPANRTVAAGGTATFTMTATGATGYQWQLDAGQGWVDVAGATATSYTLTNAPASANGRRYRCRVSNATGSDTTKPARLIVT